MNDPTALVQGHFRRLHTPATITPGCRGFPQAPEVKIRRSSKFPRSVRTITMPTSVLDKLDYSQQWIFTNRGCRPVRANSFWNNVWNPGVIEAKLDPRPRFHDLRHTCASWMITAVRRCRWCSSTWVTNPSR